MHSITAHSLDNSVAAAELWKFHTYELHYQHDFLCSLVFPVAKFKKEKSRRICVFLEGDSRQEINSDYWRKSKDEILKITVIMWHMKCVFKWTMKGGLWGETQLHFQLLNCRYIWGGTCRNSSLLRLWFVGSKCQPSALRRVPLVMFLRLPNNRDKFVCNAWHNNKCNLNIYTRQYCGCHVVARPLLWLCPTISHWPDNKSGILCIGCVGKIKPKLHCTEALPEWGQTGQLPTHDWRRKNFWKTLSTMSEIVFVKYFQHFYQALSIISFMWLPKLILDSYRPVITQGHREILKFRWDSLQFRENWRMRTAHIHWQDQPPVSPRLTSLARLSWSLEC